MRIFYLDPGLRGDVGHHANYCRYIAGELRARGIETRVFAHRDLEPSLQAELGAVPLFRVDTYAWSDGDPVCGWLTGFDSYTRMTYEDLRALPATEAGDVALAPSVQPIQMAALVEWWSRLPPGKRPAAVLEASATGLRTEQAGSVLSAATPDPRREPRPTLFRFVAKRMPPSSEGRFRVVSFDRLPGELLGGLLERPVPTLPMPYRAVVPLRSRAGAATPTVAILGHQKFHKGYDRLPEILTALLQLRRDFRLLLQHVDPRGPEELIRAVRAVAASDARVILEERPAGRTEWPRLLERSDLILCPQRPEFYTGFSAVGTEAIANGIPLVVPPGTPIERLIRESRGGGLRFERFEPAAIAEATRRALDDLDTLADRAYAAALRWPTWQGPARLVDALLALCAA